MGDYDVHVHQTGMHERLVFKAPQGCFTLELQKTIVFKKPCTFPCMVEFTEGNELAAPIGRRQASPVTLLNIGLAIIHRLGQYNAMEENCQRFCTHALAVLGFPRPVLAEDVQQIKLAVTLMAATLAVAAILHQ